MKNSFKIIFLALIIFSCKSEDKKAPNADVAKQVIANKESTFFLK